MARDYDSQLLESVAVRRRRLRDALAFGRQRSRRTLDENLSKLVAGVCVAAILCAGTIGWSFLRTFFTEQKAARAGAEQPAPDAVPVPADWVGGQVTFARLRSTLHAAGVPRDLFVLPDQPRPTRSGTASHFVVTRGKDAFTGGVVEYDQGRIAAEFPTEDEACRWLYAEIMVRERPPQALTAQAEQAVIARGVSLAAELRSKIANARGPVTHRLEPGQHVDQFGQESGSVLFPLGLPFRQRGLPASARVGFPGAPSGYHRYRVVRPLPLTASISAPARRDDPHPPDGAVRLTVSAGLFPRPPALPTVRWLLRSGYVERVNGTVVPQ